MSLFLEMKQLFAAMPPLLNQGYVLLVFCTPFWLCLLSSRNINIHCDGCSLLKTSEKSITEDLLKQLYHVTSSQKTTDFKMLSGALKIPERKILKSR